MADGRLLTGKQRILRFARNALAAVIVLLAAVYLADYGILRYRIATGKEPFDSVTIRPLYAVPQKDHRTEYLTGDPMDQRCTNSLFPHAGSAPCWYLRAHREQRITL